MGPGGSVFQIFLPLFADNMYDDFVLHPKMTPIRDRTVWVHVTIPGQEPDAQDLPAG